MKEQRVSKERKLGNCTRPEFTEPFQGDLAILYLGIDQHKSQITVNLRGEDGVTTVGP